MLWKWCTFIFTLSFTANLIATLIFWFLLFPAIRKDHTFRYGWVSLHGGPLAFSLIDFGFNRIVIERNQWVLTLKVALCYSTLLVVFTKTRTGHDFYIYPFYKL